MHVQFEYISEVSICTAIDDFQQQQLEHCRHIARAPPKHISHKYKVSYELSDARQFFRQKRMHSVTQAVFTNSVAQISHCSCTIPVLVCQAVHGSTV